MAKTASPAELSLDSGINPRPARPPRPRRARATPQGAAATDGPASQAHAIEPSKFTNQSVVKPVLIGVGIGAAVAVTGLVIRSRSQVVVKPERPRSALTSALAKAALFAVGRLVVQRAGRVLLQRAAGMVANRAARRVAKAWIG